MSRAWTRVSLASGQRHVEVVLPSDVPVGQLMPELLHRFEPGSALDPTIKTLTVEGSGSLPWPRSLGEAGVSDGSVLHITDRADSYPAPVVYDVVDETAASAVEQVVWPHGAARTIATASLVGVLSLLAARLVDGQLSPGTASWSVLATGLVMAAMAAVPDQRRLGLALPMLAVAAVLGWEAADRAVVHQGMPGWGLIPFAGVLVLAWFGGHRQPRHAAFSLATFVLLGGAWLGLVWWLGRGEHAGALLAVVTMVLLGYLPRLAITTTGLASLDDRALRGEPLSRALAHDAIQAAHQGLVVSAVACALGSLGAVRLLVRHPWPSSWAIALATIVVLLTALRSRAFPLVVERVALLLAAGGGFVLLLRAIFEHRPDQLWIAGLLVAGCAAAALLALVVTLPEHTRASLRLLAGRVEGLLALSLVPVAVGLFGVYGQLAHVFQN